MRGSLQLCVGNTGTASSTKTMVEGVARLREREPEVVDRTFEAIRALVLGARLALEGGDRIALGRLMDRNQTLLGTLRLSTPEIEPMCELARAAGALGAKLTGAGGGGCVVALVPSQAVADAVLEAWKAKGLEGFATSASPEARPTGSRKRDGTMSEASAIAHPNVALSKYWGKREGGGNFPAVPSLSVTLSGTRDADARPLRCVAARGPARPERRARRRGEPHARVGAARPRAARVGRGAVRRGADAQRLPHGERPRVERLGLRGARPGGDPRGRPRLGYGQGERPRATELGERGAQPLRRLRRAARGRRAQALQGRTRTSSPRPRTKTSCSPRRASPRLAISR